MIQYRFACMRGTYWVDCEVLEVKDSKYLIAFTDFIIEERIERWVEKDSLTL